MRMLNKSVNYRPSTEATRRAQQRGDKDHMDGLNTNNLGKRLFWFCLGLAINSCGIALITKAGLGTSQISSVPYVLSFQFTWLPEPHSG